MVVTSDGDCLNGYVLATDCSSVNESFSRAWPRG